ncbi:MAG: molybdenum cofactor guanylyltransferase [Curvibacter sp.]|nr:molybdenum cofactor guanylyltransferase [Curvibacter sp.]
MQRSDITGLVLAGGQGQRMGAEKGLALLCGHPLAWHALERLRPQVGKLALNANRCLDEYRRLGVPVWTDAAPEQASGPLAGLLSGLQHSDRDWVVTVPCDVPEFPSDLVERLTQAAQQGRRPLAVVRAWTPGEDRHGAVPPLQAVFCLAHRSLAADLQAWLDAGGRKMGAWMARHGAAEALFDRPGDPPAAFSNLNTQADLRAQGEAIQTVEASALQGRSFIPPPADADPDGRAAPRPANPPG